MDTSGLSPQQLALMDQLEAKAKDQARLLRRTFKEATAAASQFVIDPGSGGWPDQ